MNERGKRKTRGSWEDKEGKKEGGVGGEGIKRGEKGEEGEKRRE